MITRELIKSEIDQVRDEYLEPLFRIIKVFEKPADEIEVHPETKKLVEEYIQTKGVKEAILIETALLHHLQALKELPDDIIIPPRISVSEESGDKIMEHLDNPQEPTRAMKSLFEDDKYRPVIDND